MRNKKIGILAECAVMLALAFALSMAKLYEMPLGGSVTVGSMLPIMMIGIKYGPKIGVGTAFLYSVTQALQALASGNVFPYCETGTTLVVCILFDYIVPFTILGLSGIFMKCSSIRTEEVRAYIGMAATVVVRFLCHFITGVVIWKQWAPEGMGKYLYSFLYNGSFLGVDFAILLVIAVLMLRKNEIRRLLGISPVKNEQEEQ